MKLPNKKNHFELIDRIKRSLTIIHRKNDRKNKKRKPSGLNLALLLLAAAGMFWCCQPISPLETALLLAGDNRRELETVLEYYSGSADDPLKLKAARYLIENMPGHYSLDNAGTDNYFSKVESAYTDAPAYLKHILYCLPSYFLEPAVKKEDVQYITAEFLIRHIDRSFELWNSSPWKKEVNEELFFYTYFTLPNCE